MHSATPLFNHTIMNKFLTVGGAAQHFCPSLCLFVLKVGLDLLLHLGQGLNSISHATPVLLHLICHHCVLPFVAPACPTLPSA